ncbi:hypothetical protein DOY81_009124 [Sarcophaga bullata]|nr:hypothetical protein DOY81_009124 [Sarcophaga bullata]
MTAEVKKGPLLGQRHMQVFLLFLSITVNYIVKYNAGVSVVAMTNAETTNPDFPTDRTQWQIVFAISAFVFASTNLFYIICGSTKLQPWDDENFLQSKEIQNEDCKRKEILEDKK